MEQQWRRESLEQICVCSPDCYAYSVTYTYICNSGDLCIYCMFRDCMYTDCV